MSMAPEELKLFWFSDEIVRLVNERDEMTTSDMQGIAGALARKIYQAGKEAGQVTGLEMETDPPEVYPEDADECTSPHGHEFVCTGTAYGGDDERYMGEGRSYCMHCGADGDA